MDKLRVAQGSIWNNRNIILLYMLVFVSYANISMPYPIFAPTFLHNQGYALSGNHFLNVFFLGLMLACYPLGQLIGSPFTGALSDRLNKRKMLAFMLLGTASSYFLTGLAFPLHKLSLVFFMRILTGVFESSIVIIQALLVEECRPYFSKAKTFSYFYVMCTLGFIVGPLFGGMGAGNTKIAFLGVSTPFYLASLMIAIFSVVIYTKLTIPNISLGNRQPIDGSINSKSSDSFKFIIFLSWICFLGVDTFLSFSPIYLVQRWQFNIHDLMLYSVYLALLLALVQGYFVPLLSEIYSPQQILKRGLILIIATLGVISLPFSHLIVFLISLPLIALSISTITTALTLIVSNKSTADNHGRTLGLLRLSRAGGDTLVCLISGALAAFLPALPMILAAFIFIVSFMLLSFRIHSKREF